MNRKLDNKRSGRRKVGLKKKWKWDEREEGKGEKERGKEEKWEARRKWRVLIGRIGRAIKDRGEKEGREEGRKGRKRERKKWWGSNDGRKRGGRKQWWLGDDCQALNLTCHETGNFLHEVATGRSNFYLFQVPSLSPSPVFLGSQQQHGGGGAKVETNSH